LKQPLNDFLIVFEGYFSKAVKNPLKNLLRAFKGLLRAFQRPFKGAF
jgi:hypothetical protein